MQVWEYETITVPKLGTDNIGHRNTLNRMGADGWEMVGIVFFDDSYRVWFKRPKSSGVSYR